MYIYIYAEVMKIIQCTHPSQYHNDFAYVYIYIYLYIYIYVSVCVCVCVSLCVDR